MFWSNKRWGSVALSLTLAWPSISFPLPAQLAGRPQRSPLFAEQALSLEENSGRFRLLHREFYSNLLTRFKQSRARSRAGASPEPLPPRSPRAPAERAVRDFQVLARWQIPRLLLEISREGINELVNFYQIQYPELTVGNARGLPAYMVGVWETILWPLLPHRRVKIVSGPTHTLLVEDVGEDTEIKDTLLAMHGDDIQARNRMLAWVLGRREARVWISEHRRHPAARAALWVARLRGFTSDNDQIEYAAALLTVLRPFGFYRRMRQATRDLLETPAAPLEAIVEEFRRYHSGASLGYLASLYHALQAAHGSVEEFSQSTHKALAVAKMGRGIEDIAAALASGLREEQRTPQIQSFEMPELTRRRILDLNRGVAALSHVPFNPAIIQGRPDFGVEDEMDGYLKLISNFCAAAIERQVRDGLVTTNESAEAIRRMRGSLLALLLAEKLRQITRAAHGTGGSENLRRLAVEMQLLHVPLADRFGLVAMRMDLLEAVLRATRPEEYQSLNTELEQTMGLPHEQTDALLETAARQLRIRSEEMQVKPLEVIPHRKSLWSIRQRKLADDEAEIETEDPPATDLSSQENLLVIQVVVDTPEQLAQIRGLERFIGQARLNPNRQAEVRRQWKGQDLIEYTVWVEVDHPRDASRKIPIELQILTREGYRQSAYGQSSSPYDEPGWIGRLKRRAARIASEGPNKNVRWNLLFDNRDRDFQMTGDLASDLDNNLGLVCDPLEAFVFPKVPVTPEGLLDPSALDPREVSDRLWRTLRMPALSKIADWLLHPVVGSDPERCPQAQSATVSDTSAAEGVSRAVLTPSKQILPLTEFVVDGQILVVDHELGTQSIGRDSQAGRYLKTSRATLLVEEANLRREMGNPIFEYWAYHGAELMAGQFGEIDEVFEQEVLWPAALRLGFNNPEELRQALGANLLRPESLLPRYDARYPPVQCTWVDYGNRYQIAVIFEEDYIGSLDAVRRTVKKCGFQTVGRLESPESATGAELIRFDVKKRADVPITVLTTAIGGIDGLRRLHLRGQDRPERDAKRRLLELEIHETDKCLDTLAFELRKAGFNIVDISPKGGDAAIRRYEMILAGPDTAAHPRPWLSPDYLGRLENMVLGVASSHGIDLDTMVHLDVHWATHGGVGSYVLTITGDQAHPDLLPRAVEVATQMGWNLDSPIQERVETRPEETVVRVHKPEDSDLGIEHLASELRNIRLPRDVPLEVNGSRFLLHFYLADQGGTLNQVMQYFRAQGIRLLAIQDEPARSGDTHAWFDMEVVVPAAAPRASADEIASALSNLTLPNSPEPIIPEVEVIGLTMNRATARRMNEILVKEIRALPGPDKEKWVYEFHDIPGEEEGTADERAIDLLQKAILLAGESTGDPRRPNRDQWPLVYAQTRESSHETLGVTHLLRSAQRAIARNGQRSYMAVNEILLHDAPEDFHKLVWRYIETYWLQSIGKLPPDRKPLPPGEFEKVPEHFARFFPHLVESFQEAEIAIRADPAKIDENISELEELVADPGAIDEHIAGLKQPVYYAATAYLARRVLDTFTSYPDRMLKGLTVLTLGDSYAKYAKTYVTRDAQYEADGKLTEQADNYDSLYSPAFASRILSRGIRHLLSIVMLPFPGSVISHRWSREDYLSKLVEESLREGVELFLYLEADEVEEEARLDLLNTLESFFAWAKDPRHQDMLPAGLGQSSDHPFMLKLQNLAAKLRSEMRRSGALSAAEGTLPGMAVNADLSRIPYVRDWAHRPMLTLNSLIVTGTVYFHAWRHWGMAWIIKIVHFAAGAQGVAVARPVVQGHTDQVMATPTNKFEAYLFILAGPAIDLIIALTLGFFGVHHAWGTNPTVAQIVIRTLLLILASYFAILGRIGSQEDWNLVHHGISVMVFPAPLVANADLGGRPLSQPLNRATLGAINEFMLSEAQEHIPPSFWDDLPVGHERVGAGLAHLTPAGGEVDQSYVEDFKKAWMIALEYHDGYVDSGPADQIPLAEQQERTHGHIPYIVHLWTVTWNLINEAAVTDPDAILTSPLHDFKEDVPMNVYRLIADFFLRVFLYFSMNGQFQLPEELRLRLVHLMKRFPTLADKFFDASVKIADTRAPVDADEAIGKEALMAAIRDEMKHRLMQDFPKPLHDRLVANIGVMTQEEGESTAAYTAKIRRFATPWVLILKLVDMAANLSGRFPSQPYRYIRSGLALVTDERADGSESYAKGRRHFLNALIQRVKALREELTIPDYVLWQQSKAHEAAELLPILDDFFDWADRHPGIVKDLPDWPQFEDTLRTFRSEAIIQALREVEGTPSLAEVFTMALQELGRWKDDPVALGAFLKRLHRFIEQGEPANLAESAETAATLRHMARLAVIDNGIRSSGLSLFSDQVRAGSERFDVQLGNNERMQTLFLQVGAVRIVSRQIIRPELVDLLKDDKDILIVDGPIEYDRFLVTTVATMLANREVFQDAVVEEFAAGKLVLSRLALRLGARRVVANESDERLLQKAAAFCRDLNESGHPTLLRADTWTAYAPADDERLILLPLKLQKWFQAPAAERRRLLGDGKIIRLADLGPEYAEAHGALLEGLISEPNIRLAILGGYGKVALGGLEPADAILRFQLAGWQVQVNTHQPQAEWSPGRGNTFITLRASPPGTPGRAGVRRTKKGTAFRRLAAGG